MPHPCAPLPPEPTHRPKKSPDHAYAEVFLRRHWLKLDSYTIDAPLFAAARAKLKAAGLRQGFGIHRRGINEWCGGGWGGWGRAGRGPRGLRVEKEFVGRRRAAACERLASLPGW
jgi:hypothetical protein